MGTARALRVALIQSGRIVEDRTFTGRAKITVGTEAKSTFLVPMADVPVTTAVFDVTKKGTTLLFDPQTIGRVSLSGAETSLQDCAARASPRGKQLALPLTDDAKGRLSIGEVSLLFQFVDAPKAPVPAELPRGARGLLAQVDRSFLAILGISLAAHFAGAGWLSNQPVPEERDLTMEELSVDRFAAVLMPIPRPKKTEPELPSAATPPKSPANEPVKPPQVASNRPSPASIKERVRSMGMVGIIGSRGDGEGGFGDLMKDTGMTDLATALRGAQNGLQVASIDDATATKRRGNETGGTSEIDPISTERVKNVNLREQGPAILTPRVSSEKVQLDTPDIDERALTVWLNARKPAIQNCYERELKRSPTLQGRIVLRFAITHRGRVGGVGFSEDTLRSHPVEQCIADIMRGWVLPFTPEDDVPVCLPFIFAAGQ